MAIKNKTFVISLGGSVLVPAGPDPLMIKKYVQFFKQKIKQGYRFAVVIGGGTTAREYQAALKTANPKVSRQELDWLGISATMLNAELVSKAFGKSGSKILFSGGAKPGHSTDFVAVKMAKKMKADAVINLTNLYYVYTADPAKHKNVKILKELTWQEFKKIVGGKWVPGANLPFDPAACQLAEKLGISVIVSNGKDLKNLSNILLGKKAKATIIK